MLTSILRLDSWGDFQFIFVRCTMRPALYVASERILFEVWLISETDIYHLNFPEDLNYIKAFGISLNIHLPKLLMVNLHWKQCTRFSYLN